MTDKKWIRISRDVLLCPQHKPRRAQKFFHSVFGVKKSLDSDDVEKYKNFRRWKTQYLVRRAIEDLETRARGTPLWLNLHRIRLHETPDTGEVVHIATWIGSSGGASGGASDSDYYLGDLDLWFTRGFERVTQLVYYDPHAMGFTSQPATLLATVDPAIVRRFVTVLSQVPGDGRTP